jgi:pepF/M3 family oligoendopeptidase
MHKKEETLLSKFSTVSSDSWVRLYNSITSRIYSDFPYKKQINKYSLSMLREFTTNKSPEVRKKAFKAEIDLCKKISIPAAECLNSLKGESILSCQSRNFQSPLQRVLFYSRMKNETLYSLLDSIKQNLPKLQKYFKLKSKILNTKKALPYYDIFAPINAENNNFEFTDAKRLIINNFFSFSDDLGILAKNAFENNWIDAFPKKGKRGGAFCINLPFMKESRILTNFNNSFKDCITLAHELGHAYHNKCMTNQTPINTGSPMPLAETASIFAENIVKQNALKSFTENSKISIIEADLSDMGQKVIDIYSRFLFEEKIFKKREKNILSSEELCELMLESQIEAYGDSLDKNYLHPYMWIVKPHYYGTDFYNFPYAFGLLFAKGLFKIYKNEGRGFVDNYRNFLSMTNRRTVEESAKTMDIDVTTSEFWNMSIAEYVNDISLFAKYA